MNNFDKYSDCEEDDFLKIAFSPSNTFKHKKPAVKPDHFTLWSDDEFHYRFRLQKSTVRFVLTIIEDQIECVEDWNIEILAEHQLLFTLRYFATGTISDTCFDFIGIRKSTGKQIVSHVCEVLAFLRSRVIYFPRSSAEIKKVEKEFFEIAKFPRCVGVIGCTHVKVATVAESTKLEMYRNENGFHSLKVQVVNDATLKIENIVARWPGAARDSTIFLNSKLHQCLEAGEMSESIILGDLTYPLRKYLLTPVDNALSAAKVKYNEALNRTRATFSATCELWKRRFPILVVGVAGSSDWVQCVVVATAVLHNITSNIGDKTPKITAEEENALKLMQIENQRSYVNEKNPKYADMRNFFIEYFSRFHGECRDKEYV